MWGTWSPGRSLARGNRPLNTRANGYRGRPDLERKAAVLGVEQDLGRNRRLLHVNLAPVVELTAQKKRDVRTRSGKKKNAGAYLLAKVHNVDATLAQRRTDRRCGCCLARGHGKAQLACLNKWHATKSVGLNVSAAGWPSVRYQWCPRRPPPLLPCSFGRRREPASWGAHVRKMATISNPA